MVKNWSSDCNFNIRRDLSDAHEVAWERIASPGTWLTAQHRIAIAVETRNARERPSCAETRQALSPSSVGIVNKTDGVLNDGEVELIHRVVCDPGRLSESWVQSILSNGMREGEFIEIVGIIAMVMIMDTFTMGLGMPDTHLLEPISGEPVRYQPAGAKKSAAWLPIVEPEDAVGEDEDLYPNPKVGYIYRALSGVPQSLRDYWAVANVHYMPGQYVYQFHNSIRAITRSQIELIAARVSALHQCVY